MKHIFKTIGLVLGLMAMSVMTAFADKKDEYLKTYNYGRAMELIKEDKNDEAVSFLKKEINDHNDNGYALAWLASLQSREGLFGAALSSVNQAMKYLDKQDDFYAFCLELRSYVYQELGEDKAALDDLNMSVNLFPQKEKSYQNRAEYYLDKKKYDLANQDFLMMTKVESGSATGYVGSGLCLRNLKRYAEAIAQFDYALKLDPKYSRAYAQRAYCYNLTGKQNEAADDVIKSLDIDGEDAAFTVMQAVADSAFEVMDFKLKIQQVLQPTEPYWSYCRGVICERAKRWDDAIGHYDAAQKKKYSSRVLYRMARCIESKGDYAGALAYIEEGLAVDSSDVRFCVQKASYLHDLGRTDEAIAEFTHVTELIPDYTDGYSGRAQVKLDAGDLDGALEDLNMALMIDPEDIFDLNLRGNIYLLKDKRDLALKDFERVVALDTIPSEYVAAFYALYELGEKDKAIAAMDSLLATDSIDNAYDAACLYSRMGETDKSLNYLKTALEGGYWNFYHIEHDIDLQNIRATEQYHVLIEQYKSQVVVSAKASEQSGDDDYELRTEEIPFSHEGGVTKVRCKINDLPLHFVFDTGASDVTISTVEATFMLKNGYLSEKDIAGKQKYMTADGNISEGTNIILRKVNFGNLELDDVKASVVMSQKAPLLLGQTVLQRLGKIEIDNERSVLKVTQRINR